MSVSEIDVIHNHVEKSKSPISNHMALISTVSGASAGLCTDLALFPLDTVKTRLQSAQGFAKAGGFRGLNSSIII